MADICSHDIGLFQRPEQNPSDYVPSTAAITLIRDLN